MTTSASEVDLRGIRDPQKPVALGVGAVLVVVGVAGVTGLLDMDVLASGLVLGVFGVPLWFGITAMVAGLLGIALATYAGGATTFDKVAAGLVLPAVLFLAITDWALASTGLLTDGTLAGALYLVPAVVALLVAVVIAAVGTILLRGHSLALVFPVVALLAILDWALSLTAMTASETVNLPTLGLLVVLEIVVAALAFEGGKRQTGRSL
jgi:hypothetical protein